MPNSQLLKRGIIIKILPKLYLQKLKQFAKTVLEDFVENLISYKLI